MTEVLWTESALDDFERLDRSIQNRVLKKISWLSEHFADLVPEALSGELSGTYKIRIGDWRAIYTIEKDAIIIHAIGHRKNIYTS